MGPDDSRGARRPTLQDVAAASGVSRSTVSFVLNSTPGQTISAATRERVRAAADRLGYRAHSVARALREGTTRVVLLELDRLEPGNALRSFVAGMRAELAGADHSLLVHVPGDADSGSIVEAVRPRAVLRLGEHYDRAAAGDEDDDADGGWVDGLAAHSFVQVEHLVRAGHRVLAVAVPGGDGRVAALRLRYAQQSAQRLGLATPATIVVPDERAQVARLVEGLRRDRPELTAIAAFDDAIALRLLAGAADTGIEVPTGLAIIGFDDDGRGAYAVPALTSVRIDAAAYGRRAARRALGLPAVADDAGPAVVQVRRSA